MSTIIQRFEVVCTAGTTVLIPAVEGASTTFLEVKVDPKAPDFTIAGEGETNTDVTVTFDDEGTFVFSGRYVQA